MKKYLNNKNVCFVLEHYSLNMQSVPKILAHFMKNRHGKQQ